MNSVLHDALPLATTPAFTPGRARVVAQAAPWQVALARAAAESASAGPAARGVAPDASAASIAGEPATVRASPADAAKPAGTPVLRSHCSAAEMAARAAPAAPPLLTGKPGASEVHAMQAGCAAAAPPPAADPPEPAARPPRNEKSFVCDSHRATRVHVEGLAEGNLTVWLGADGDATAVALKAAAVVAELQRGLPIAGHRLARLVCNGVTVYVAPHLEKETP